MPVTVKTVSANDRVPRNRSTTLRSGSTVWNPAGTVRVTCWIGPAPDVSVHRLGAVRIGRREQHRREHRLWLAGHGTARCRDVDGGSRGSGSGRDRQRRQRRPAGDVEVPAAELCVNVDRLAQYAVTVRATVCVGRASIMACVTVAPCATGTATWADPLSHDRREVETELDFAVVDPHGEGNVTVIGVPAGPDVGSIIMGGLAASAPDSPTTAGADRSEQGSRAAMPRRRVGSTDSWGASWALFWESWIQVPDDPSNRWSTAQLRRRRRPWGHRRDGTDGQRLARLIRSRRACPRAIAGRGDPSHHRRSPQPKRRAAFGPTRPGSPPRGRTPRRARRGPDVRSRRAVKPRALPLPTDRRSALERSGPHQCERLLTVEPAPARGRDRQAGHPISDWGLERELDAPHGVDRTPDPVEVHQRDVVHPDTEGVTCGVDKGLEPVVQCHRVASRSTRWRQDDEIAEGYVSTMAVRPFVRRTSSTMSARSPAALDEPKWARSALDCTNARESDPTIR